MSHPEGAEDIRMYLSHKRAILYVETDLVSFLPGIDLQPAALRWDDKVLACNKAARCYGISDNLPFKKAVEICPGLITLGAEQIPPLTQIVNHVNKLLRSYSVTLERVNVDECYLDVTSHPHLVNPRNGAAKGFGRDACPCGCQGLLSAARLLGEQLRTALQTTLGVSSRIGVASSKLLARLAAIRSSPEQCRVIVPDEGREMLLCENVHNVLPLKIVRQLQKRGIHTTADVRKLSLDDLQESLGLDDAVTAVNTACGVDVSPVATSDLWRLFCIQYEIREKLCVLLLRLCALLEDDGRTPLAVKLSVRKWDPMRKTCSKEARTGQIATGSLPSCGRSSPDALSKLMNIVTSLFHRIVDMTRPFQLTLLGLAFVRFQEPTLRVSLPSMPSMASCLLRKREISVEAPVSISYEGDGSHSPRTAVENPTKNELVDGEGRSPREKKAKLDIFIKSKNFFDDSMEVCSPSKLKVADLSLGEESLAGAMMRW